MRKTMQMIVPLLLPLTLAACSSLFGKDVPVENPPPPGVSYRVEDGNVAGTAAKAQEYCRRYGKKAKQQGTSKASDSTIVQYSCS